MTSASWVKVLLSVLIVFLGTILVAVLFLWQPTSSEPALPAGGHFTLTGSHGPVALQDYAGKVVVLYFGYTFCPDVCPTSLALIGEALSRLTDDEIGHVQGIFISLDPPRDTPERLAVYAPFFHKNIVGVTGQPETIAELAHRYGVNYRRYLPEGADENSYVIDHSSFTYLVAPDGKLAAMLPHATDSTEIVNEIRALLR